MPETCYTACALIVKLPAADDREMPRALERFIGDDADIVNTQEAGTAAAEKSD
jgi:hypothetical protein